ncbi:MAG TPA: ABC transporter ATP-binding protein [Anaerolineae bacterium]|nr:ABC transporter ATP-binding protein [Anaerolineae bacterium]HQH38467.1 ABC transporter ATP-binding protein [Anaerolineae bacterium]
METTALVEVQNLFKRYTADSPYAVDGISFTIHTGELFSLLGPNGAGKTTAISVISTLLRPTAGAVRVDGYDVQRDPMAVRRVIGVVPQELALYDDLTAHENLRFWGEMRGLHGAELQSEIAAKLALIELTDRAKDRVGTFSGGMKRRLNLAVGLLGNPKLLMLDEPTVAIDPQSRRYILDWVKKLREQGVTILYTTHYMEEAQELSDRIGIIDHGKLIALGTLAELIQLVGQHETLRLQLLQEAGGAELAASLQSLEGVIQASATDGEVLVNVTSAEATLASIISTATGLGLSVRTIDIREPNLEAVFLHLTGRALRD